MEAYRNALIDARDNHGWLNYMVQYGNPRRLLRRGSGDIIFFHFLIKTGTMDF